jgi:phage-related holin
MLITYQLYTFLTMREFFKNIGNYFVDIIMVAVAFLSPITWMFWWVIGFIILDTITGIMKAGKDDVKNVTSKKGSVLISKLIFYFAGIIIAHAASLAFDPEMPLAKMVLGAIIIVEIKSLDENMKNALGWSFFDIVLNAVKRKTEPLIAKNSQPEGEATKPNETVGETSETT